MKDYYEILEINKKASSEMVENAYKTLSKKYKNENADIKTVNDLNDNKSKQRYCCSKRKDRKSV